MLKRFVITLGLCVLVLVPVQFGFVQDMTSLDWATDTYTLPWHGCDGDDSGNMIDCPAVVDNHWQCAIPGGFKSCNGGGVAELGICRPTKMWRYMCIHKGFAWESGGKLRGCWGKCGTTTCTYAPDPLSCHDDYWLPQPF